MKKTTSLLFAIVFAWALALPVQAGSIAASLENLDHNQVWTAHEGTMELEIRGDFLPDFGLEITHHGQPITDRQRISINVREIEPVRVLAPYGNLEALDQDSGRLEIRTGLAIRHGERMVDLDHLFLVTDERAGHPLFRAVDGQGRVMFTLTHMHILAEHERGLLTVQNAEVEASPALAGLLDLDVLADMPIGLGWLDLAMDVPPDADTSGTGPGCDDRPIWPQDGQFEAEVALIGMSNIAYQGTEPGTGRIKTAPSATLKNLSLADIPWIRQFDSHPDYPHEPEDQHPFLVWNIYKIQDGRIQMLAESGVKHAFLTINVNCDPDLNCGDGNILWPGCEDTYSSGNNDTSTYQGPKDEIEASLGLWDNCGSFFDPECNGSQSGFSGQWLNRLLIHPDEFQQDGAEYFMDAWYVIQYDTNIWSTMGYRPIDPAPSGTGWTFNPGTYVEGTPVVNEWVAEGDEDPMVDHVEIVVPSKTPEDPYPENMPQGHLRLLVQVTEVEEDRYRYNYALQNFDFERGVSSFSVPLSSDAEVFDTWFGGVEGVNEADWEVTHEDGELRFQAPEGEKLPWFTLFNFEIEVDVPPEAGELELGPAEEASVEVIAVDTIVPGGVGVGPVLAIDPEVFDFGDVVIGETAGPATIVLENVGDETLSVDGIASPTPPFFLFSECSEGAFELEPEETCEMEYTFEPESVSSFGMSMEVDSNAASGPDAIELEGNGQLPPPTLSVTPDSLDFGELFPGDQASMSVELESTGDETVEVTGLGEPDAPYSIDSSDCGGLPFELEPEATCDIIVTFAPEDEGTFDDALVIESNAEGSPHTVTLEGDGLSTEIFKDRFEELVLNTLLGRRLGRVPGG